MNANFMVNNWIFYNAALGICFCGKQRFFFWVLGCCSIVQGLCCFLIYFQGILGWSSNDMWLLTCFVILKWQLVGGTRLGGGCIVTALSCFSYCCNFSLLFLLSLQFGNSYSIGVKETNDTFFCFRSFRWWKFCQTFCRICSPNSL